MRLQIWAKPLDGELTSATTSPVIVCVPNIVDRAEIVKPNVVDTNKLEVELTSDDFLDFELVTYDAYDNVANPTIEEVNLDIFIPGCSDETSAETECDVMTYSVEKDPSNNHFYYNVQTMYKGEDWKIVSRDLFP